MKTVRATLNSSVSLNQVNEFGLNSPAPRGTSDAVSISLSGSFSYDPDMGVAYHAQLELLPLVDEVSFDLDAGTVTVISPESMEDPFGNALFFTNVHLLCVRATDPVDILIPETGGWVTLSESGILDVQGLVLEGDYPVEEDSGEFSIKASTLPVGDESVLVDLIIVGDLESASSV
jgi:hypothetical protein